LLFSPDGKYFIVKGFFNEIYVGEFSAKSKKFIRKISLPWSFGEVNIVNVTSDRIFVSFVYMNRETHDRGQLCILDFY